MKADVYLIMNILSNIISILLLIATSIGFIFKKFITQWIETKFKSALNRENEQFKATLIREQEELKQKFVREIETYKSILTRDLEEYKLNIDVRRNLYLQFSNQKIEVFKKIISAYDDILGKLVTYCKLEEPYRESEFGDYNSFKIKMLNEISTAKDIQKPFKFYIDTIKIGLPLAKFYKKMVHLFPNDKVFSLNEVLELVEELSYIQSAMMKDLFGEDYKRETLAYNGIKG